LLLLQRNKVSKVEIFPDYILSPWTPRVEAAMTELELDLS